MTFDPYEVLGVDRGADASALKAAYRALAKRYHPDRNPDNPDAEDAFKRIAQAYSVLSDPAQRQAYDAGSTVDPADFVDADEILREFDELLRDILGPDGAPERAKLRTGADIQATVSMTFEQSLGQQRRSVTYHRKGPCTSCAATGSTDRIPASLCGTCDGVGKVTQTSGRSTIQTHCSACQGKGVIVTNPCRTCFGSGRVDEKREVTVTIPAGVENGTQLRLTEQGSVGERRGAAGDLYVRVEVAPHALFRREGNDVRYQVPITFSQASLGATLTVLGPRGPLSVTVPPGTHSGRSLRVPGGGVERPGRAGHGDLIIDVYIHVPTNLAATDRERLAAIADIGDVHRAAHPLLRALWSDADEA